MTFRHCFFIILVLFSYLGNRVWADDKPTDWGFFLTPIKTTDIDPRAFAEWVDGGEKPLPDEANKTDTRAPGYTLWAQDHLTDTDLSAKVTRSTQEHYLELPSIEGDSHENSELVTTCPGNKESCRARTRSYEEKLKQQALAKADSQIDSQALQDPDLAKVVTAWPALAPALKAAILAITDSSNQIDSQISEARIYVNPNPA